MKSKSEAFISNAVLMKKISSNNNPDALIKFYYLSCNKQLCILLFQLKLFTYGQT